MNPSNKALVEIPDALLHFAKDDDGGVREFNLVGAKFEKLPGLLQQLLEDFEDVRSQINGNPIGSPNWTQIFERLAKETGSLQVDFGSDVRLFSALQLFISVEASRPPFVELTFSPRDVIAGTTSVALFNWFRSLQRAAAADEFYFRYENAGWEEGDSGTQSGVVATSTWVADWPDSGCAPR